MNGLGRARGRFTAVRAPARRVRARPPRRRFSSCAPECGSDPVDLVTAAAWPAVIAFRNRSIDGTLDTGLYASSANASDVIGREKLGGDDLSYT